MKDPEIMLFGKKIYLPEKPVNAVGGEYSGEPSDDSKSNCNHKKIKRSEHPSEVSRGDHQETADDGDQKHDKDDEDRTSNSETITDQEDADQIQSPPEQSSKAIISASSEEEHDPSSENQPTKQNLKRPDKILPCPRCNSKDTKFCYYNNYNVNQPRHFCKSCQRYWTAGGTMRHIPVGAGRRKNKNSTAHFRRFTISEALHYRINNDPFSGYNPPQTEFRTNGTVLSFRSDPSNSPNGSVKNRRDKIDHGGSCSPFSCINKEENKVTDRKHCNKSSSVVLQNENGLLQTSQVPFGSGFMWPFPGIYYPAYPIPVYQNWNSWPVNANSSLFDNSRSGELIREKSAASDRREDSSLVIPKTLRMDDPEEAAKSSIWTTLGIKYDDVKREDLFESLQPKKDGKKQTMCTTTSPLLQANPAALSRSIRFQESV